MAKGYSISIASDTKAFATGVQKGIIEPLEDAAEILQDIGSDGGRDLGKLEGELRDAQAETDDVREAFSELQKEIRETGRKARTDFANPMNRATADAGRGMRELKDEAKQNFAEVASSFDGTAQGIADGIQGTLGGAAVAVGGAAGVALGAAAVVGGTVLAQLGADAERMKEITSTAFEQMAEDGIEAWKSIESETQRLRDAYNENEDQIERIATITGLSFETVASAWAGNADAVKIVNAAYSEMKTELRNTFGVSVEAANATIAGWDGVMKPLNDTLSAYDEAERKAERLWGQIVEQTDEATHQTRLYRDELREFPTQIRTQLLPPDGEAVRRAAENSFQRRPVQVRAQFVTRDGRVVV